MYPKTNDFEVIRRFWAAHVLAPGWSDVPANRAAFDSIYQVGRTRNKPDMSVVMQRQAAADYRMPKDQFKSLNIPMMQYHGTGDSIITKAEAEELNQCLNGNAANRCELRWINGAGHNVWPTHGHELANIVLPFIDAHDKQ